jgi:hypothetical protein
MMYRHFILAVLVVQTSLCAADVRLYGFTKGHKYSQTSPTKPASATSFEFHAFVELTRPNAASSVTLKWPNQSVRSLTNYTTSWRIRENYTASSGLNNAAPNGTYNYSINTAADGLKAIQMTLSGDFYPEVPYLLNFGAAQEIDYTKNFVISLGPTSAGNGDFIHVRVEENGALVWETPATPDLPGALNGTATSITIPANTLKEGRVYKATVSIWKILQRNTTYTGALGVVAYVRQTELPLRTAFSIIDTHWFGLMRRQRFVQTSSQTPSPITSLGIGYAAFAEATDAANITAASVRLPNAVSKNLARSGASWKAGENFDTVAALAQACPNGICNITLGTLHNGQRQVDLDISSSAGWTFPAPPAISNWDEANRIDSSKSVGLTWSIAGGAAADFLQVRIEKNGVTLFRSGDHPKAVGALNGQSTGVTIPAGILAAGEDYQATILYFKPVYVEPYVYPKVQGVYGIASETTGTLRTRGGNFPRPTLEQAFLNVQTLELSITGTQGRQYVVQGTKDYSALTTVLTTNAPQNSFTVRIPFVRGDSHNVFRIAAW